MAAVNPWAAKNLPPVVVVSGTAHHARRREVQRAIKTLQERKYRLLRIDGSDHQTLEGLVASRGFMTAGSTLVVVSNPEKVDPAIILKHYERGDGDTLFLLVQDGGLSRKKTDPLKEVLAGIPQKLHATFEAPKPWDAEKVAVKFLEELAQEHGMKLADNVASGLVSIQGTDLGFLEFELLKCVLLARSEGVDTIEVAHVRGTLALVSKAGVDPVVKAVATKNTKALLRALDRLRTSYPQNSPPTMLVCAWLGKAATRWLHVATLRRLQVPEEDLARMINMNPYVYKREILPVLARWKVADLVKLLKRIAGVTRAVRQGKIDPWIALESGLVSALR